MIDEREFDGTACAKLLHSLIGSCFSDNEKYSTRKLNVEFGKHGLAVGMFADAYSFDEKKVRDAIIKYNE